MHAEKNVPSRILFDAVVVPDWPKACLVLHGRKAVPKFKVGDIVKSDHGNIGNVEEIDRAHSCIFYGVRFNGNDLRWLFTTQGDAINPDPKHPSEIVEFTAQAKFVAQFSIDPSPGSAFGLAAIASWNGFRFASVDDGINVLDIWDVM